MFVKSTYVVYILTLLVVFSVTNQHVDADLFNEQTHSCTKDDFLKTENCTISCSGSFQDKHAHIVDHAFKYYSTNSNVSALIFNYSWKANDTGFEMKLPLAGYSAGYYSCEVRVLTSDGTKTHSHSFQIDPDNKGVNLGSKCGSPVDCLALDARCSGVCYCGGSLFIPYDNETDAPACLSAVPFYGYCNTDEQCQVFSWHNYCINNRCLDLGTDKSSLSSGAIAGIAIGCLAFGLVLVAGLRAMYAQCTS